MLPGSSDFPVDLVGRYKMIDFIGRGAMGTVFRVHDSVLRKNVAIKTLTAGASDKKRLMRFQKEAKAIGNLKHSNIVRVLDFGITSSGTVYMVMECVNGKSLQEFITDERAADLAVMIGIFHQICKAVAHAHRHGVVHRDLKTTNIMLEDLGTRCPTVRVIDFGLAHLCAPDERGGFDTTSGKIVGSPAYMSPESTRGEGDSRSDIYSLGCLLQECLTGEVPFTSDSLLEMTRMHAEDTPPRLSFSDMSDDVRTWSELQVVIDRCLAKNPDARYQTVEQLIDDVVRVADEIPEAKKTITEADTASGAIEGSLAGMSWQAFISDGKAKVIFPIVVVAVILGSGLIFMTMFGGKLHQKADMINNSVATYETEVSMYKGVFEKAMKAHDVTDADIRDGKLPRPSKDDYKLAQSGITDDGMRYLVKYSPLQMDIAFTKVTDKGLSEIAKMKRLTGLTLSGLEITDAGLKSLSGNRLEGLILRETPITDRGLESLSEIRTLKSIKIDSCEKITDKGIEYLARLPLLQDLSVEQCHVTPAALSKCKKLAKLNMSYVPCSDKDLISIASTLKDLHSIALTGSSITEKGLNALVSLPNMIWIGVGECRGLSENDLRRFEIQFDKTHRYKIAVERETPYQGLSVFRLLNKASGADGLQPNSFKSM